MHKAVLIRAVKERKQTLGSFHVFRGAVEIYEAAAMELPYQGNQANISCIPVGTYKVVKAISPRYGESFLVKDVPGRSHILIHPGNYNRDTKGCILLGAKFLDINRDGLKDITNSRRMVEALEAITDEFMLTIIDL